MGVSPSRMAWIPNLKHDDLALTLNHEREQDMSQQSGVPPHIKTTETVVRLYVLLSQYLDRCHDEGASHTYPESEFQAHLAETRAEAVQRFSTNRVVHNKIEQEYERLLTLGSAMAKGPTDEQTKAQLRQERGILQTKTETLSDLLAVFRSLD